MVQSITVLTKLLLSVCEGVWFQHDSNYFPDVWIGCGCPVIWLLHSPDWNLLHFYFLMYVGIWESTLIMKKVTVLEILIELHISSHREYKKGVLWCHLFVHMYHICMDVCPTSTCTNWMDLLFIFGISDFIRYRSVPDEYDILASKIWVFQMFSKMAVYTKMALTVRHLCQI
jgi:hypothetical protein